MNSLKTIGDLRRAIMIANGVYIQVRFGLNERRTKISKAEAIRIIRPYSDELTAKDLEMTKLGSWWVDGESLYLG